MVNVSQLFIVTGIRYVHMLTVSQTGARVKGNGTLHGLLL